MSSQLKAYFPMIWEREEIQKEICSRKHLTQIFTGWTDEQQEEFLNFCTGVKGIKILYDAFFKEIMNPETAPELLEEFLSLLLKKQVKIFCVLPNDSTRIADESSLLITDIVVEMEDGSLANVEVQKIGYLFPGERSACYSADLLLRQYKRVRSEKKKKFSYKDIKSVYTIVLFEKSPKEFHNFPNDYLHYFEPCSDTGLELELLQKYLFIPLDIFHKNKQNKHIADKLNAWLMFFSTDSPDEIIQIINTYPEFKSLYEKAYDICRNMEKVMGIFSEELLELDRNTAQYMIDEMQEALDRKKEELHGKKEELEQLKQEFGQISNELDQKLNELNQKNIELTQKRNELELKNDELTQKRNELDLKNDELARKRNELDLKNDELAQINRALNQQKSQLEQERHLHERDKTVTAIHQIRRLFSKGLPADECADILDADFSFVTQIYECIHAYPDWENEQIYEELTKKQ